MIDEQEFRNHADGALDQLNRALIQAGDEHGFETDFNAGALTVEFESQATRFVVSPNTPVRQIWVSALSKSFKLDWIAERSSFVLPETGQTLLQLIANRISDLLGETVSL